jgi:hypothetical protein
MLPEHRHAMKHCNWLQNHEPQRLLVLKMTMRFCFTSMPNYCTLVYAQCAPAVDSTAAGPELPSPGSSAATLVVSRHQCGERGSISEHPASPPRMQTFLAIGLNNSSAREASTALECQRPFHNLKSLGHTAQIHHVSSFASILLMRQHSAYCANTVLLL